MQRFIFTIKMLWRYRSELKQYTINLSLQTKTIFQISLQGLKNTGIAVLVLDYDGVLAGYAIEKLDSNVTAWLNQAVEIFGDKRVFILSNRPCKHRIQYFLKYFPGIQFVTARKKPYPDGLLTILRETKVSKERLLLIDDRLLTGILAAMIAGVKALWVTSPTISFRHHPFWELGFIILRKIDKWCIALVNFNKK